MTKQSRSLKWLRFLLSAFLAVLPIVYLSFNPDSRNAWVVWIITFLCSGIFLITNRKKGEPPSAFVFRLCVYVVVTGTLYAISVRMALVTDYPFPQYWSEGNRFYDYSTLLGAFRYQTINNDPIRAFITPGMAFPYSLPFIFPNLAIRTYRLYYQLVWIALPLALGFLTFHSNDKGYRYVGVGAAFSLWAYLFLEQGPIYAPLLLSAILVVIAVRLKTLPAVLLVILASLYAHYSRWTWSYAPGLWAGLLSLLEVQALTFNKKVWKILHKPVLLGIAGLVGGFLLPLLMRSEMAWTLVNPLPFTARQPLLWDRLLPNSTYPPGILLGIAWASLPALIALIIVLCKSRKFYWMQWSALVLVLVGFLSVGIVASAKIGGGSNLHNLDMYLVTIVLTLAFIGGRFISSRGGNPQKDILVLAGVFLLFCSPVLYVLRDQEKIEYPAKESIQEALQYTRVWAKRASQDGEVLFIDHRQLQTFGYITDIPLVQEYEKKELMEMAMSQRSDYFSDFYADLSNQRFGMIINEPAGLYIKGANTAFSEENNAYVKWVTLPLLCNYYPAYTAKEVNLELLLPRTILPVQDPRCFPFIQID